jgi:hypothetical protein
MVAVVFGWFVALAVLGLGFYAVRRVPPGSFRLRTGLLRGMFEFMMEIESSGGAAPPGAGRVGAQGESSGPAAPEALE